MRRGYHNPWENKYGSLQYGIPAICIGGIETGYKLLVAEIVQVRNSLSQVEGKQEVQFLILS